MDCRIETHDAHKDALLGPAHRLSCPTLTLLTTGCHSLCAQHTSHADTSSSRFRSHHDNCAPYQPGTSVTPPLVHLRTASLFLLGRQRVPCAPGSELRPSHLQPRCRDTTLRSYSSAYPPFSSNQVLSRRLLHYRGV